VQHQAVTREKWIAARKELLVAEKELTRRAHVKSRDHCGEGEWRSQIRPRLAGDKFGESA